VDASVERRIGEEEAYKRDTTGHNNRRKDMFHYLFNTTDDAGNPAYSLDELKAEANLLIIAGSDTTATTLAGFWFYITGNSRVYDKLVNELRTSFKSADDIRMDTISSCQYLRACINESLRAVPAGVGELAREVLPGGLEIDGFRIPEGTHVGCDTWAMV